MVDRPGHVRTSFSFILDDMVVADFKLSTSRCSRWRRIALSTPSLWAYIHIGWPADVIDRFLERSRKAPLSIGINKDAFTSSNFPRFHHTLTSSLNRIERLSVKWCPYHQPHGYLIPDPSPISSVLLQWIADIMNAKYPAPKLWQSHLKFYERESVRTETLANLPQLLEIRSRSISFDSQMPMSCLLREVDIDYSSMTSFDILHFLSSAPMLEIVRLHQELDMVDVNQQSQIIRSDTSIYLPNLRSFTLDWCLHSFADALFPRITFPHSAKVNISIFRMPGARVMASLPSLLKRLLQTSTSLSISVERLSIRSALSAAPFSLEFHSPNSAWYHIDFNEWSGGDDRHIETTEMFQDLASFGPFREMEKVILSTRYLPKVRVMIQLLEAFPEVKDLGIAARNVVTLLTALGSHSPSNSTPLCPHLRNLDLTLTTLNPIALKEVLDERKDHDHALEKLTVNLDYIYEEAISISAHSVDETLMKLGLIMSSIENAWENAWEKFGSDSFGSDDTPEEDDAA